MRALIRSGGKTVQGPSLLADKRTYSAAQDQALFEITYTGGNVDVYVNGLRLSPDDYQAATGVSITLSAPCDLGDIVTLVGGATTELVQDGYTKAEIGALLADKAAVSHGHVIADITDLEAALSEKAATSSTPTVSGGVKTRLSGTTLYITNDGSSA